MLYVLGNGEWLWGSYRGNHMASIDAKTKKNQKKKVRMKGGRKKQIIK